MPLRMSFHDKGFIYIKGNLHTDSFEVLLSQIDLDNFDEEIGEGKVRHMDEEVQEKYRSMDDDAESDDDTAKNWKEHSHR